MEKNKSALDVQVDGDHYKKMAIQPTEYCQRNKLGFCESCAVKYVSRHRAKGGRVDIEKAIHFLQMLLEIEYPNEPPEQTKLDDFDEIDPRLDD